MSKRVIFLFLIVSLLFPIRSAHAQTDTPPTGPVYVIQSGDTFWSIAKRFNLSVDELQAANPDVDPGVLAVGQQVVIPGLEGVTGVLTSQTVGFGETFRSLSRRIQVPDATFRKLNRLVSPAELYVGTNLIVPQQENQAELSARASLKKGESLLEMAVKQNSDPWTLVSVNALAGTWSALPNDVLYSPTGTADEHANGLPSAFVSATVGPLPLVQGRTAEIKVQVAQGTQVSGVLVDQPLHFFPMDDGSQVALQGIHGLLEPGAYPLRLEATQPDGNKQTFEQMVLIISGNYPNDPILYVGSEFIDPTVTKPEEEWLHSITEPATPERYWSGMFQSPAFFPDEFTSRYGNRRLYIATDNPDLTITGFHTGLDFGGGEGLPITAPAAGKVIFAGEKIVRGNAVIVDHGWGVYSGFWHMSKISVQTGDMVEPGQEIGLVGGTGRVTGPHQHWEIWVNGIQVDPMEWLDTTFP